MRPRAADAWAGDLLRGAACYHHRHVFGRKPKWTNWSGTVRATPERVVKPDNIDALIAAVRDTAARGAKLRVAGS